MTLRELFAWCDEHAVDIDLPLRVSAFGGLRRGKEITQASIGFDWDLGSILLTPSPALGVYCAKDD